MGLAPADRGPENRPVVIYNIWLRRADEQVQVISSDLHRLSPQDQPTGRAADRPDRGRGKLSIRTAGRLAPPSKFTVVSLGTPMLAY